MHVIQRDFDHAVRKNSEQADELYSILIKKEDKKLQKLALELRKSNKFLFLNYC
jgi:hypothetical protein